MVNNKNFYEIVYTKSADKFLCKHENIRTKYEELIRELVTSNHADMVDVKKIQGKRNNYYRMRIGSYRIIYTIVNEKIVVVTTLLAGNRGDIYKKMGALK